MSERPNLTLPGDIALVEHVERMTNDRNGEFFRLGPITLPFRRQEPMDSARNMATFWSNDYGSVTRLDGTPVYQDDGTTQVFGPRNRFFAEEFAAGRPQVIAEIEPLIQDLDGQGYTYEGLETSPTGRQYAQRLMSEAFAREAHGIINVFANNTGADSFFRSVELPVIMNNSRITAVSYLNEYGLLAQASVTEWYEWQREQWVDGRIAALDAATQAYAQATAAWEQGGRSGDAPQINRYAIGGFANELAHAYTNLAILASSERPEGTEYLREDLDRAAATELLEALRDPANTPFRDRILEQARGVLANNPAALARLEADLVADAAAQQVALLTTTGSAIDPHVLARIEAGTEVRL